jgi:hypothetical protein
MSQKGGGLPPFNNRILNGQCPRPLACRILRQHVTERIGIVSEWSTPFPLDQANGKFRQRDFDAG